MKGLYKYWEKTTSKTNYSECFFVFTFESSHDLLKDILLAEQIKIKLKDYMLDWRIDISC